MLTFFDANVVVGRPQNEPLFVPLANATELSTYLTDTGLSGALIWHWAQAEGHPSSANPLLQGYLDADPQIFPCWAILPPVPDEPLGLPEGLLSSLPGAVRLFPEHHRYLMNRVVWGDLLDELTARRVPVLLSLEHGTNWEQVYALLHDYPELTCVLCDIGTWSMDRYTYPLLQTYPNVCMETSMLALEDGGVEAAVQQFGAQRLVFGTGFPKRYAEAAMLQLTHADISDADRQAIAADNMRQLITEARHA